MKTILVFFLILFSFLLSCNNEEDTDSITSYSISLSGVVSQKNSSPKLYLNNIQIMVVIPGGNYFSATTDSNGAWIGTYFEERFGGSGFYPIENVVITAKDIDGTKNNGIFIDATMNYNIPIIDSENMPYRLGGSNIIIEMEKSTK